MAHPAAPGVPRRAARRDHRSLPDGIVGQFTAVFALVRMWIVRHRGREALRELAEHTDEHLLADIGVTREEALRRAQKWFWQA